MSTDDDPILRQVARANPVATVDEQAHTSAAATALLERMRSENPRDQARMYRRRTARSAAAATGVGCVLIAGGMAAATGLIPPGVTHYFRTVSPPGARIIGERMLVEHVSANGIRDQIWTARNSAGQLCQEIRTVSADGRTQDASVSCETPFPSAPPPDTLTVGFNAAGRPWPSVTYEVIAHDSLGDAARMNLSYPNGKNYPLTYNPNNGWAIGVVPPAVATLRSVLLVRNKNGTVIARKPLPPNTGR